jgi:hypothetical protein
MALTPTRGDVIMQFDMLRGGVRLAVTTIRRMKQGKPANPDKVLARLAQLRSESKAVRESIRAEEPRRVIHVR